MRPQHLYTFAFALLLGALPRGLSAQRAPEINVQTATRPAGLNGEAFNLLTWPRLTADEGSSPYERCNLYRKIDPRAPYPRAPINSSPLQLYTDCSRIKALIPEGSEDWKLIQRAMSGSLRGVRGVDPCDIGTARLGADARARLELLARSRWRVAVVLGLGYVDRQVQQGTEYLYQLRGIDSQGKEVVLASDIKIKTGFPIGAAPPSDVEMTAGDSRVLVHWGEVPTAAGFDVLRATSQNGAYEALNAATVTANVKEDLEGQPLDLSGGPRNGYVDAQEWDASGDPTKKLVGNVLVATGPENGKTYYYKIASLDLLGFAGTPSASVSAVPQDKTPPAVPAEVATIADDKAGHIQVRWVAATRDAQGHPEAAVAGYRVFRKEDPESAQDVQIGGLILQPSPGTQFVSVVDASPVLRPQYGEKKFWYQVECEDAKGNVSARSAPMSGFLHDITPPTPPVGVTAEGFEDKIRIEWTLNNEPDIDGYEIYRSLCDGGDWPCASFTGAEKSRCQVPFALLAYVSHLDALANGAFYEDMTVPAGSPLCYAYLVKALDQAQNRSGEMPPDPLKETIVCQRLRDKTPPEPAVITGLLARDHAVLVEWIAAPVQDVHAYHVYRSAQESGPWTWVGGMTVAAPPETPQPLLAPYQAAKLAGCDVIPLKANESFSIGSFLDTGANPHNVYWYKSLGIDWDGNESKGGVAASTFTFSTQGPAAPTIAAVTELTQPCGLRVSWTPSFQSTQHSGFALFRSTSPAGPFQQVGSLLQSNQLIDREVVRGVTYYYKAAVLELDGDLSVPSAAKSGKVN